ncbi:MAG: hypothetical protein LBN41_09625 [Enterobacteriaceae bacterium]|jgi:cysteinyl-tRNA synthetase|nr:hypothetical protein [Enterobacteriaceae bacterium]
MLFNHQKMVYSSRVIINLNLETKRVQRAILRFAMKTISWRYRHNFAPAGLIDRNGELQLIPITATSTSQKEAAARTLCNVVVRLISRFAKIHIMIMLVNANRQSRVITRIKI